MSQGGNELAYKELDRSLDAGTSSPQNPGSAARAASLAESLRGRRQRRRARTTAKLRNPNLSYFGLARSDGAIAEAENALATRVRAHLPKGQLTVKLTDNRYTMLTVKRERIRGRQKACASSDSSPMYHLRVHHMFADASPTITRALALYIAENDRDASALLGDYIDANQHRVRPKANRRTARLDTKGTHHDLLDIYNDLNRRYFDNKISATITWGQRCGKARRRNSIKMGSYSLEDRAIRIHRSLDRAYVPRFFVEWVVYHEMLHQVHQVPVVNGRRQFHTPAFRRDEALFEHFELAQNWERDHIEELLTY